MNYDEFISSYLDNSSESVEQFARRAGVHRSSVYRAKAGDNLLYSLVEKLVRAAGGKIIISIDAPRKKRNCSQTKNQSDAQNNL